MADFTVIADVTNTLYELLNGSIIIGEDVIPVILGSPGEIESDTTHLSVFLYRIEENDYLKNNELQQLDSSMIQHPPLNVDLFYMLTAYSEVTGGGEIEDRNREALEEHTILGRAMQIIYDNSVLRGSALQGSLVGTDVELRIILATMSMENVTQIWSSFQDTQGKPYKPSAFYQITPVPIDSTRRRDIQRVIEKQMQHYQMTVRKREQ